MSPPPARAAIENTLAKWSWGMDQREPELLRAAYVPHAVITMRFPGQDAVRVEGRDAIIERMLALWERVPKRPLKQVVTNVLIEDLTDHSARVRTYMNSIRVLDEVPLVTTSGFCIDRFVVYEGEWLIEERLHEVDGRLAH
jgi:hypothetical protein